MPPAERDDAADARFWTWACAAALATLAIARLGLLFLTPLELYPDEAQYWAWAQRLDWGYFSKPPMIAWLIAASTGLGGDAEAWVRLPGWACQTLAGGFVFLAGRRLYGARVGFWAAVVYALAPGVLLSSVVAATDAPLLLGLSAATWAYAGLLQERRRRWAVGLGLALGFAALGKYAAIYFAIGLIAHAATSRWARAAWSPARLAPAGVAFAVCLAPNLIWNATHGFETVQHTAGNANWSAATLFNPVELAEFVGAQFGVLGPAPFAVLLGLAGVAIARRRATDQERMLWSLLTPPLLLVAGQALLSRANANWAAAFLPPAAILVAAWMSGLGAWPRRALAATLVSQTLLQAVFATAAIAPAAADALGLANGLKRARGWAATSAAVAARVEAAGPVTGVAVDDRFLFNALRYYGRDWLSAPGAPPLTAWVREDEPQSEAETSDPLTPALGRRALAVSLRPDYRAEFRGRFARASVGEPLSVPLDRRRRREIETFVGDGFGE